MLKRIKDFFLNVLGMIWLIVSILLWALAYCILPYLAVVWVVWVFKTFWEGKPLSMIQIIVTVIICIIATILLNNYFRDKYKTEYDKFYKREKEFELYRENELKNIKSETAEIQKLRRAGLNKSPFLRYANSSTTLDHIAKHECLGYNRFYHFIRDEYNNVKHEIESIDISASHKDKRITVTAKIKGSAPELYTTTLDNCTCYDFRNTLKGEEPCKHMYLLAYELALLNELPLEEIKKELALETHRLLKAQQQEKNKTSHKPSRKA